MIPDDLSNSILSAALDGVRLLYSDVRLHETALVVAQECRQVLFILPVQANRMAIPMLIDAEKKREGLDDLLKLSDYVLCSAKFPQNQLQLSAEGFGVVNGRLYMGTAEKIPPSELVDTTGAGDAFIGAVLYAICANMPPEKMLPFAAQVILWRCPKCPNEEYGLGGEISAEGYVYSYGILLLELFSGKRPTCSSILMDNGINLHDYVKKALPHRMRDIVDPRIVLDKVDHGLIVNQSYSSATIEICLASIFEVGILCSVETPRERIDISVAIKQLHAARDKLYSGGSNLGESENLYT